MNALEQFFFSDKDKFSLYTWNMLSNCCGAIPQGELYKNFGRCSDCLEMAEFSKEEI